MRSPRTPRSKGTPDYARSVHDRRRTAPHPDWHSSAVGAVVAALAVAATTALVYPLAQIAPVVALGVVYLRRRAARLLGLGRLARRRHGAGQRAGLQLLPHPADRPLHDLRRGELGRARRLLHRRAGGQHAGRARPRAHAARPRSAARRPTWPPRWRACCCAARASPKPCPRSPSVWPTPSSCPPRPSSCAPSRGTTRRVALPLDVGTLLVPGRPAAACRSSACASAWCRRSRRSSGPPSSATRCCARSWRRAPCAARTTSRPRCCGPSRTTCARR